MNYRKAARREALAGYLLIAPAVGLFIVIGLFTFAARAANLECQVCRIG